MPTAGFRDGSPGTAQPAVGLAPRRGTSGALPVAALLQLRGAPRSLSRALSSGHRVPTASRSSGQPRQRRRCPVPPQQRGRARSRRPTAQPRDREPDGDPNLPASRPVRGAPPEGTVREWGGLGTASTARPLSPSPDPRSPSPDPRSLSERPGSPRPARPYHGSRAAAPRSLAAVVAAGRDFYRARPAPSRRCHLTAAAGAAPARRAAVTRLRGAARPGPAPGRGLRETGPA